MANFQKAMQHHAKAGAAMKASNAQQAMHHLGHMMVALKASSAQPVAQPQQAAAPQPSGLRAKLSSMMPNKMLAQSNQGM